MLDIDHGSYPYVTSSSPTIGGAITGLGLNPQSIAGVVGVYKAYCTRVGGGPMPSEMHGEVADELREKAEEYGTTTGRPRRLGWFDAVAGKIQPAGQRLHRDGTNPAGHPGRQYIGENLRGLPSRWTGGGPLPGQYQFPGPVPAPSTRSSPAGTSQPPGATNLSQLPQNATAYVRRIEELVGCKVQIISTGPSREETILVEPVIR